MRIALVPLRRLLEERVPTETLQTAFHDFICERDPDVKNFLDHYALGNEAIGASRTYLAIDEAALESEGRFVLVAFFSLAIAVTDYTGVSNRLRRKIMGDYPRVSKESHFPGFLLGQLARDDRWSKADLDCSNLLGIAEEVIGDAAKGIGGNILYLDCKKPLVGYYEEYGYTVLTEPETDGFYKMFKCLPKMDLNLKAAEKDSGQEDDTGRG